MNNFRGFLPLPMFLKKLCFSAKPHVAVVWCLCFQAMQEFLLSSASPHQLSARAADFLTNSENKFQIFLYYLID
jgi:hypothetical protein